MPREPELGGPCPYAGCGGTMEPPPPENCSCHIAPPCHACTDRELTCTVCGWSVEDGMPDEPPQPVAEPESDLERFRRHFADNPILF